MTFESFPHPPARRATHVMVPGRSGLGRTIAHATPHCSLHPPAGSRPAAQSWPLHVARWASRFADASSPGGAHSGIFTVSSPSPQALRTAGRRPLREAHSTTAHHPPRLALTPRLPCARRAAVCLTCPAPPLSIARDPPKTRAARAGLVLLTAAPVTPPASPRRQLLFLHRAVTVHLFGFPLIPFPSSLPLWTATAPSRRPPASSYAEAAPDACCQPNRQHPRPDISHRSVALNLFFSVRRATH